MSVRGSFPGGTGFQPVQTIKDEEHRLKTGATQEGWKALFYWHFAANDFLHATSKRASEVHLVLFKSTVAGASG